MATLYFNNAVGDSDWGTLGNWWLDDVWTVPATGLPTSSDDVVISESISNDSFGLPTVANMTVVGYAGVSISLSVTNLASMLEYSSFDGTLTGNIFVTDNASLNGTVNGDAAFTGSGLGQPNMSYGTVTGTSTFSNGAYPVPGCSLGDAVFADNTYYVVPHQLVSIQGTVTFSGTNVTFQLEYQTFYWPAASASFPNGTPTFNLIFAILEPENIYSVFSVPGHVNAYNSTLRLPCDGDLYAQDSLTEDMPQGLIAVPSAIFVDSQNGDGTGGSMSPGVSVSGNASYTRTNAYGAYQWYGPQFLVHSGQAEFRGTPVVGYGGPLRYAQFASVAPRLDLESATHQILWGEGYANQYFDPPTFIYEQGINGSSILGVI